MEWHLVLESADGSGLFGVVVVDGAAVEGYYFAPSGDHGVWNCQKEGPGGTFPEDHRYEVRPFAPARCGCKGFKFQGRCRHVAILQAVLQVKLGAQAKEGAA